MNSTISGRPPRSRSNVALAVADAPRRKTRSMARHGISGSPRKGLGSLAIGQRRAGVGDGNTDGDGCTEEADDEDPYLKHTTTRIMEASDGLTGDLDLDPRAEALRNSISGRIQGGGQIKHNDGGAPQTPRLPERGSSRSVRSPLKESQDQVYRRRDVVAPDMYHTTADNTPFARTRYVVSPEKPHRKREFSISPTKASERGIFRSLSPTKGPVHQRHQQPASRPVSPVKQLTIPKPFSLSNRLKETRADGHSSTQAASSIRVIHSSATPRSYAPLSASKPPVTKSTSRPIASRTPSAESRRTLTSFSSHVSRHPSKKANSSPTKDNASAVAAAPEEKPRYQIPSRYHVGSPPNAPDSSAAVTYRTSSSSPIRSSSPGKPGADIPPGHVPMASTSPVRPPPSSRSIMSTGRPRSDVPVGLSAAMVTAPATMKAPDADARKAHHTPFHHLHLDAIEHRHAEADFDEFAEDTEDEDDCGADEIALLRASPQRAAALSTSAHGSNSRPSQHPQSRPLSPTKDRHANGEIFTKGPLGKSEQLPVLPRARGTTEEASKPSRHAYEAAVARPGSARALEAIDADSARRLASRQEERRKVSGGDASASRTSRCGALANRQAASATAAAPTSIPRTESRINGLSTETRSNNSSSSSSAPSMATERAKRALEASRLRVAGDARQAPRIGGAVAESAALRELGESAERRRTRHRLVLTAQEHEGTSKEMTTSSASTLTSGGLASQRMLPTPATLSNVKGGAKDSGKASMGNVGTGRSGDEGSAADRSSSAYVPSILQSSVSHRRIPSLGSRRADLSGLTSWNLSEAASSVLDRLGSQTELRRERDSTPPIASASAAGAAGGALGLGMGRRCPSAAPSRMQGPMRRSASVQVSSMTSGLALEDDADGERATSTPCMTPSKSDEVRSARRKTMTFLGRHVEGDEGEGASRCASADDDIERLALEALQKDADGRGSEEHAAQRAAMRAEKAARRRSLRGYMPAKRGETSMEASRDEHNSSGVTVAGAGNSSSVQVSAVLAYQRERRTRSLRGLAILVDVRDLDGTDASSTWVEMLKSAGAKVVLRLGSSDRHLTHIVYKSGKPSTLHAFRAQPEPKPFVVGVQWVVKCIEEGKKVDEEPYLIEVGKEAVFHSKKRVNMAPKQAPMMALASPSRTAAEVDKARRKSLVHAPAAPSPLGLRVRHADDMSVCSEAE